MALLINLRHLEKDSRQEIGELTAEELNIADADELLHTPIPLKYDLEINLLEQSILVQGSLSLELECECSRCLKRFKYPIEIEDWACNLLLDGEDAEPVVNDCVDLTPHIREHMLLEFPQHPVCGPECKGWVKAAEQMGFGKPDKVETGKPSPWAELDKLKLD